MTFGSLFAGIGGFDLGFERAGLTCKWQVELDDYATRVLERHWPNVRRWRDVATFPPEGDWTVDLICGGFPCQPVSLAGQRLGAVDERWLWPDFYRVIRTLEPRWVVVENTPGLLSANDLRGRRGGLLGGILADLAASGFDCRTTCLSAAALGAPYIRDRLFILARREDEGAGWRQQRSKGGEEAIRTDVDRQCSRGWKRITQRQTQRRVAVDRNVEAAADTHSTRPQERRQPHLLEQLPAIERSDWWDVEPDVVRVVSGVSRRVDRSARVNRIRCLGNAVIPQVAEVIGRWITNVEGLLT